jgi:hypothetical protein
VVTLLRDVTILERRFADGRMANGARQHNACGEWSAVKNE